MPELKHSLSAAITKFQVVSMNTNSYSRALIVALDIDGNVWVSTDKHIDVLVPIKRELR